jgi:succinate dehydrogenase / fumarate reductase flavoprotein subunit
LNWPSGNYLSTEQRKGKIDQRYFGAHRYRRTCYAADRIGLEILRTLVRQVKKRKIRYKEGIVVTSILVKNKQVYGVTAVDFRTGKFFVVKAKSIIIATGGCTRVYKFSTHPEESYGDGIAIAYKAGAELIDMEMIQFHPTGMVYPAKYRGTLATEALRGEGAYLLNAHGERFMKKCDPQRMELSARDVVARAIWNEVREGRGTKHGGVWLDIRHVDPKIIKTKLPKMYKQFKVLAGQDITKEKIEVYPTAHYTMGGIRVNPVTTETKIHGLFAAGETTGGLHGANRLGGNSLAETVVFGKRAGEFAAKFARRIDFQDIDFAQIKKEYERILSPFKRLKKLKLNVHRLKEKIREIIWNYAGIARTEKSLRIAFKKLNEIKKSYNQLSVSGSLKRNHAWLDYFDIGNMLICCEAIVRSALIRKESRGAHFRLDFTEKDDRNWLANNICKQKNGRMILQKVKVKS